MTDETALYIALAVLFIWVVVLVVLTYLGGKYDDMRMKVRAASVFGEEPNFTRFEWWLWKRLLNRR